MHRTPDLMRVLKTLALTASLLGIYGISQHFTGVDPIRGKEIHDWNGMYKSMGLLGHHITFGVIYAWVLGIGLAYLSEPAARLRTRIIWLGASASSALAVLYSYSRAAWVGAMAAFLTVVILRRLKVGKAVVLLLAMVIAAVALEPSVLDRAGLPISGPGISGADKTRVLLLRTSLRMIQARPVLGHGPGTFMAKFEEYGLPGEYRTTCHPHNDLVHFAVRSGIPGVLVFLAALTAIVIAALRSLRAGPDPDERTLLIALLSGLAAILASGLFQCNLSDAETSVQAWLIMGSLAYLARRVSP
jgi:O-antigen ligase